MKTKCEECGVTGGVSNIAPWWTASGNNCCDFQWGKHTEPRFLCQRCETNCFRICDACGAAIDIEYWGVGYLPRDWQGDPLCPECAAIAKAREERT